MIRLILFIAVAFAAALFAFELWIATALVPPDAAAAVSPAELHHGYLGALVAAIGLAVWHPGGALAGAVGLLLIADDTWQHARQLSGEPKYQSPLHRLFAATLWRIPGVPWLCRQANALFARLCRARKPAT